MKIQVAVDQASALRLGIDAKKSTHAFNVSPSSYSKEHREAIADRLVGGFNLVKREYVDNYKRTADINYLITVTDPTESNLIAALNADILRWNNVLAQAEKDKQIMEGSQCLETWLLGLSLKAKNMVISGRLSGISASEYAGSLLLDDAVSKTLYQDWDSLIPGKKKEEEKVEFEWQFLNLAQPPYAHLFLQDTYNLPQKDSVGYVIYPPDREFWIGTHTESTGFTDQDREYLDSLCARMRHFLPDYAVLGYEVLFGLFEGDTKLSVKFELMIRWHAIFMCGSAEVIAYNYSSLTRLKPWQHSKKSNLKYGSPEEYAGRFATAYDTMTSLAAPAVTTYECREFLGGNVQPIWDCIIKKYAPNQLQQQILRGVNELLPDGVAASPVLILDAAFIKSFNVQDPWIRLRGGYVGVNSLYTVKESEVDWVLLNVALAAMSGLSHVLPPAPNFQELASKVGALHKGYPKTLEKNSGAWLIALNVMGLGD